jgi:hypothetical protein
MAHPFSPVESEKMRRDDYRKQFGNPGLRAFDPEALELWAKIKSLTITDVLVVKTKNQDERLKDLRTRLATMMGRMTKVFEVPFRVKVSVNTNEGQCVIWKESKD